jgi:hypothetical protein
MHHIHLSLVIQLRGKGRPTFSNVVPGYVLFTGRTEYRNRTYKRSLSIDEQLITALVLLLANKAFYQFREKGTYHSPRDSPIRHFSSRLLMLTTDRLNIHRRQSE